MSEKPVADWDPRDESVLRDQRRAYDEMCEHCPVAHSDYLNWSLFRHSDIMNVIADPDTFSNASRHRAIPNGMDAPEHTVYRRMLEPFFTEKRMAAFEPECRKIAAETVRELTARNDDSIELIAEFAEPFPLQAFCAFLGWPNETWERLRGWNRGNQHMAFSQDREAGRALAAAFMGYVEGALQTIRAEGTKSRNGITSDLMRTEVNGAPLSDDDIVSIMRNWTAGHGTVGAALGNVLHYLALNTEAQERLRREPDLLPAAIDEIMRVDGPLVMNHRTTTRDVEIGGRSIAKGDRLTLIWIAANRDGRVFDDPEEVRFERDQAASLVFGSGIHDCVGAPLARLELRIAVEALLAGTDRIELDNAMPPTRTVVPSNGLQSLHVRLTT